MGKGTHNLSEIFIARQVYINKAENYVRRHGKTQFGEGSLGHDLLNAVDMYGIVPNEVFNGLQMDTEKHNHAELASILEGFLKAIIANKGGKLTPMWREGYSALLNVYLGEYPENFTYNKKGTKRYYIIIIITIFVCGRKGLFSIFKRMIGDILSLLLK